MDREDTTDHEHQQQLEEQQQEEEMAKSSTPTFVERVAKIQSDLKAPKGQHNKFGGYNYRSCEDILEAVKPLLGGLMMTIDDDIVEVGGRVYVKATATITDGVGVVSNSAYAREAQSRKGMDDSQITGATSSYARKYALNGLFLIDDTKDADTQDNRKVDGGNKTAQAAESLRDSIDAIKAGIKEGNIEEAAEAWFELSNEEKKSIWVAPSKGGPFTTEERSIIKSQEFRKSYYGDEK